MTESRAPLRTRDVPPLLLIVAIGAALRLYALPQRGLIYWDEAKFALEGVRFWAIALHVAGTHASLDAGKTVGTAKPGHALLLALGYLVLGNHASSALAVDAVASILSLVVLYLIARRLVSPVVSLIATLFLAVSQYDVIYARSVLSETDANLIFLVAVLLAVIAAQRRRPGLIVAAGVLGGAAFTVNYRIIIYLGALGLVDLLSVLRERGVRAALERATLWAAGVVVVPLAWQAADILTRLNGLVLFRSELTGRPMWYLQEAYYQIHQGKQARLGFDPGLYVRWYLAREGWWSLLLLVAGMVLALVRRDRLLLPAALVLIPYAIYVFAPFVVPRNLEAAMPFVALLQAYALVSGAGAVRRVSLRAGLLGLVVAATAFSGALGAWHLTAVHSAYLPSARYVERHAGVAMTDSEILRFYLRDGGTACRAYRIPESLPGLARYRQAGLRLVVTQRYAHGIGHAIAERGREITVSPLLGPGYRGENLVRSEEGLAPRDANPPVLVVSIAGAHLPAPSGPPAACHLNVVL